MPASPLTDFSAALARLAAGVAHSLVTVRAERALLSGFALRPDLVVTAEEAIAEQEDLSVTLPGGETAAARIAGRDPSTDIALLRLPAASLTPLALDPASAETAALALLVGAEHGAPSAALGIVSRAAGPWHSLRGGSIDVRLELDLRLSRTAQGGAVLAVDGRLLGMAVAGPRHRTLVIPTTTIARVAAVLERDGRMPRGYLGLGLQPVTVGEGPRTGAVVLNVDPQGPGAAAGLLQGDILIGWDGAPIGRIRALLRGLGGDSVGRVATLIVLRGGAEREVKLTIGERPGA